jgi:pilus assembly protein FimV
LKENTVSNLTKTLAVVSLLAPASGYSLGIGDIKLHSTLNQNLDAEISLVVSAAEKASDIKINIAPPDKFDEAGVPWASFLSKIKFEKIVGANGSVLIKLSSREAVKEPFLDFLVEVNWPKGSIYREFTVLLDPPTAYRQATVPVLTSPEIFNPEQAVIPLHHPVQKQQTRVERSINGAGIYGPTRRNDTLWKVAEQAGRQAGVSVEQMMIAMYEENPHAFYKENVHALLAGKALKIPEREIVLKYSRKQALAEFNRQTKAWKNRLAPAYTETASAKKGTPDNQLTLVAPTETDVAENVIISPENEQVSAKKRVEDAASKTIDTEGVNVVSPVNDALQNKVAELEKQLAMMQQILALKDQQLAALQNQYQAKPVVKPQAAQATTSGQTGTVNPVTQQKPVQPDVKQAIQTEPEATSPSITPYLWVGGIGAGTLFLLGWLWWRKRKLDEQSNSQSLPAFSIMNKAHESNSFFSTSIEIDSAKNAVVDGKGSFFNELTFGGFNTFDTDQSEIDPISEADVYLAYGRYQQAEELMRDVIKDQPERDEWKLKLLEIFYSNENKQAFETYANELAKAGKKDDVEFWAKVSEMGSQICQNSTLFSFEEEEFSPKENSIFEKKFVNLVETDDIKKNDLTDIEENHFSLSSFGELFKNEVVKETPQATDSLLDYEPISFEDEIIHEQQINESIDFDLSKIATKTEESSETPGSVVSKMRDVKVNDEFESFDFDFEFGSNETEAKGIDEIDTNVNKDSVENFQLTDSLTDKSSGLNSSFGNDSLDRNFYFDRPISGLNGADFDQQGGLEFFDLTDMDELETKLDLAKAYIDMSDTDAAKDMACEVLEKGTAEQKKVAQSLLDDLK